MREGRCFLYGFSIGDVCPGLIVAEHRQRRSVLGGQAAPSSWKWVDEILSGNNIDSGGLEPDDGTRGIVCMSRMERQDQA